MKRNRIVINFDNQSSPSRRAASAHRSSRGGVGKVLALIAILIVLIAGGIAAGGYFWWRHYQSSPAYSLALLVDATQRNDKPAIDGILDTDKIAADFVSQIRARMPASALWAAQIESSRMTPKVKDMLHDQLVKQLQHLTDVAAGKPFVIIALAVPQFADIDQQGNTAKASVTLHEEQIQLTMVASGDYWRVTAVQDDKLAQIIAQAMVNTLPLNGDHIQDELQRQLNSLGNGNR